MAKLTYTRSIAVGLLDPGTMTVRVVLGLVNKELDPYGLRLSNPSALFTGGDILCNEGHVFYLRHGTRWIGNPRGVKNKAREAIEMIEGPRAKRQ